MSTLASVAVVATVMATGGGTFVASAAPAIGGSVAPLAEAIRGVWAAREYRLAAGPIHVVRGQIFFLEERWQVAFFVLGEGGAPQRGSAEGGSYRLEGDRLTFLHEFNFSVGEEMPGLPAAALRMTLRTPDQAAPEEARVRVEGDAMTLSFPSGNSMTFVRGGPLA